MGPRWSSLVSSTLGWGGTLVVRVRVRVRVRVWVWVRVQLGKGSGRAGRVILVLSMLERKKGGKWGANDDHDSFFCLLAFYRTYCILWLRVPIYIMSRYVLASATQGMGPDVVQLWRFFLLWFLDVVR